MRLSLRLGAAWATFATRQAADGRLRPGVTATGPVIQAMQRRYDLPPRRQRVGIESAVDREEPQPLDMALREQHPVERIASCGLRLDRGEGVTLVDREDFYAQAVKKLGKGAELVGQLQLAQSTFDGDLPKARRAQMMLAAAILQ